MLSDLVWLKVIRSHSTVYYVTARNSTKKIFLKIDFFNHIFFSFFNLLNKIQERIPQSMAQLKVTPIRQLALFMTGLSRCQATRKATGLRSNLRRSKKYSMLMTLSCHNLHLKIKLQVTWRIWNRLLCPWYTFFLADY